MTTDAVGRPGCIGLVLAAGAGRRYGGPKALVPGWLGDRVAALRDGGCASVVAVLGAQAGDARAGVPAGVDVVVAEQWREGMGASLRAGLDWCARGDAAAVLVVVVDTPGLTSQAVVRVRAAGGDDPRQALVQATYGGRPGHPVLLGRAHWGGVADAARGDRGARDYLAGHAVVAVECADVADGRDVDVRSATRPDKPGRRGPVRGSAAPSDRCPGALPRPGPTA